VLNGEKDRRGPGTGHGDAGSVFALGFTLTLTPTMVLAKSVQSFFLPQLSAAQDDDARFQPLARATIEANLFNGAFLVVAIVLVGEPFVRLVMGEKYAALVPLMVWLAILQAMRVFKAGGAVVSLARAKTENAMIANSFRVLSLPLSWWAAVETGDLLLVIWIATGGEVLGVIASLVQTRWRAGVRLARLWPVVGSVVALLAAAALFAGHGDIAALAPVPRWTLAALCVALLTLCGWTMRDTQAYLRARKMENRAG
jgi:O-antigen/teichoic acid export membrane protein